MIGEASFQGARASGVTAVVEIACSIETAAWKSTMPCCRSTVTLSKFSCAMTSAL